MIAARPGGVGYEHNVLFPGKERDKGGEAEFFARLQATIALQNGTPKVIRIEQPPYANILDIWGWETDPVTTTTIIAKPGQEVLIPEQGDISMGEFRSGTLPVAP